MIKRTVMDMEKKEMLARIKRWEKVSYVLNDARDIRVRFGELNSASGKAISNVVYAQRFEPFEHVLIKCYYRDNKNYSWVPAFYSCFDKTIGAHLVDGNDPCMDENIIPYEPNKWIIGELFQEDNSKTK